MHPANLAQRRRSIVLTAQELGKRVLALILMKNILYMFGCSLALLSAVSEENWPMFRGSDARSVSVNPHLPIEWSDIENVEWKVAVPGLGWSGPVVHSGRVYLTSAVSDGEIEKRKPGLYFGGDRKEPIPHMHHFLVLCLDIKSGDYLWQKEVLATRPLTPIHIKNSYAAETPVTDGERVYAYFGSHGLYCLDKTGKVLWKKMFKPYKMRNGWGTGSSPILDGEKLIIVNDNMEESWLAVYDKVTGEQLWKIERDEPSNWSTPYIWNHNGAKELVLTGRNRTRAYDLFGRERWSLKWKTRTSIVIPTPFAAHGLLYIASGYVGDREKHVYAIRSGAKGDISLKAGEEKNEHIVWYDSRAAPYNPSTLVYGDEFYTLFDFGFLACRDARTGKLYYDKQRINADKSVGFTASPWAYRDHVFALSESGDTYVFKAGKKYELVGVNRIGGMSMANPALAGDRLLIRNQTHLFSIREAR